MMIAKLFFVNAVTSIYLNTGFEHMGYMFRLYTGKERYVPIINRNGEDVALTRLL